MDTVSFWTILAQIVNFLILYLIFKKFVWDKLFALLKEREILHEKLSNAESEKEVILESARNERLQILADAKKEAKDYLRNSHDIAAQRVKEAVSKANRDVQMILSWGERRLQKERNVMLADLRDYIIDMTIKLNKKIINNPNINREFLELEFEKIKS